jgi:DNA mismatch repair ATPase MutL
LSTWQPSPCIEGQTTLACGPSRYQLPKAGTVVTCKDLFYNHPVRRDVIRRSLAKQVEDCRARLYRLALIHPAVGLTLTDSGARRQLLHAPPGRSLLSTLSDAFGSTTASTLMPISLTSGPFRIRGYVTPSHVSLPSAELQFFYVNRRFVCRTPLHKAVSKAFASACMSSSQAAFADELCEGIVCGDGGGRRRGRQPAPTFAAAAGTTGAGAALNLPPLGHPGYVLCLECAPGAYDVTYNVEKTLIEFRDWNPPLDLLHEALEEAWPQRAPFNPRAKRRTALRHSRESPLTPPLSSTLVRSSDLRPDAHPHVATLSPDAQLHVTTGEMTPPPGYHWSAAAALSPPSPPRSFGLDVIFMNPSDVEGEEMGLGRSPSPPRMTAFPDDEDDARDLTDENHGTNNDKGGGWRRQRVPREDAGARECVCCPPASRRRGRCGASAAATASQPPLLWHAPTAATDSGTGGFLCQLVEPFGAPPPPTLPRPPIARGERQGDAGGGAAEEGFGTEAGGRTGGVVRELLATWKNPVFALPEGAGADQLAILGGTPVAEISRALLDNATVVEQWGKKFILAVSAAGDLFAVDQHAADERVRLEELRGALLAPPPRSRPARGQPPPPSPIPTAVLGRPQRCQLTASELATLRANASLAWRWGWRWEDNAAPGATAGLTGGAALLAEDDGVPLLSLGGDAGVSLTGLPTVEGTAMGAEALAEYLREIAAIGVTSAPPPALQRLLASKACRGAIMFGDLLSRDDCAALLSSLRRTQLPLHCAHGRPTAALLAPGVVAAAADADELTPTKRRRMLAQRARKERHVIWSLVEQAAPETA